MAGDQEVQRALFSATGAPVPSRPWPPPSNFVWRLHGGRSNGKSRPGSAGEDDREHDHDHRAAMGMSSADTDAARQPILRDMAHTWPSCGYHNGVETDAVGCRVCEKISRAEGKRLLSSRQERPRATPSQEETETANTTAGIMRSSSLPRDGLDEGPDMTPDLVHQLRHDSSVLALAVSDEYIFAGTHNGEIAVWSLASFQLVHTVQAHKRTILCLLLSTSASHDTPLLFSSAGDAVINVWCTRTFKRLYEIYGTHDVGDMFSVAYSPQHDMVFMGAQNTTIQWAMLNDPERRVAHGSEKHPDRRHHRFFDSKAVGGTSTPRRSDERWALIPRSQVVLEAQPRAIHHFAHYGYVYCMLVAKGPTVLVDPEEEVLISGGGDGTIKLWRISSDSEEDEDGVVTDGTLQEIMVLGEDDAESVLSLAIDSSFLYAGKLRGVIELWDLDTKQRLRVIKPHQDDIMALQMSWGLLWSASAAGAACKHSTVHYGTDSNGASENVSQKYKCLSRWKAHNGKILASAVTTYHGDQLYITGANDDNVCIWHVNSKPVDDEDGAREPEDMIITALREFVSYKTVSSLPEFAEDCRKGATFLGSLFKRLGGRVEMLSSDKPHNPVVVANFSGKLDPPEKRKRILFYGHYDVVPASTQEGKWQTDPFRLTGANGYLYGRGVSDNKGPIIAALYAVTDLMQAKALDSDVVFLIEGEEEAGSRGFQETVRRHKELIGDIDYILIANSYWLDDGVPCLTYGLRGVLHATVCVDSRHPDLHSGVDGSYMMSEPLSDLTSLLSKLKGPRNRIMIPDFYDGILPLTREEEARYDDIASILIRRNPENGPAEALKHSLMARWREPNLTIHRYKVSGPDGSLVSSHASANISLRLVPGQEVDEVIRSLSAFLRDQFGQLESANSLSITIDNKAEPWLGVPGNYIFRTLEEAVMRVWSPELEKCGQEQGISSIREEEEEELEEEEEEGEDGEEEGEGEESDDGDREGEGGEEEEQKEGSLNKADTKTETVGRNGSTNGSRPCKSRKPLYIREGGSIPAIRFLEKEFSAPAAHLPCGQASDAAHLDNERLRVTNLLKSREIFGLVFRKL